MRQNITASLHALVIGKHDHILKCHHILLMEAYDYVSVNFSMKLPESFQAEMSF